MSLLTLPRELRDQIYIHLYAPTSNTINIFVVGHSTRYLLIHSRLQSEYSTGLEGFEQNLHHSTALLRTCKQIRREATPFFEDSILWNITLKGAYPGQCGSVLSEEQFRQLAQHMRRVSMTLHTTYAPYGSVASSSPNLSDVDQVLSPLKRNTAVLVEMLKRNEGVTFQAIRFTFDARCLEGRGNFDAAVEVLGRLGRCEGVEVHNESRPRGTITEGCLGALVEGLGGRDCTEPLSKQDELACPGPGKDFAR